MNDAQFICPVHGKTESFQDFGIELSGEGLAANFKEGQPIGPRKCSKCEGVESPSLPDPKFRPIRDMVLAKRLTETASGLIFLPDSAEERSQVCRVLAVGPGLMLDSGAIRPAPCQRGDKIFTTPRDGYEVTLDGEKFTVFEAMEIVGIFLDDGVRAYGAEHC